MKQRILIMGLPGSGKTTLAKKIVEELSRNKPTEWLNADQIRKRYNNWDFTLEGRLRQAEKMRDLANAAIIKNKLVVCDFVCPTEELRTTFDPDYIIWMDTIKSSAYEDTNQLFTPPTYYDYRITEFDSDCWSMTLASEILGQ
jgi:adenylylsulfate kinase